MARRAWVLASAMLVLGCATAGGVARGEATADGGASAGGTAGAVGGEPGVVTVQVLSTNDLHGALDGDDAAGGRLGGFARVAGLLDALRKRHDGPTLIVDAGDCFQGDFPVNAEEGAPCVAFFNATGHAVATLGNHEFDYAGCGPDRSDRPPVAPRCALAAALAGARYPVVVANVREGAGGERLAVPGIVPWTVVETGGVRIGVTGVVTPTTPMVASFLGTRGLAFDDPVAAVRRVLPEMKAAGTQVVVVLAHLGGQCPGGDREPGAIDSACAVDGELGRFLDAFGPDEVALVVAGHSHAVLEGEGRRTPVVETPGKGMFVGRARIRLDAATGRVAAGGVAVDPLVPVCPDGGESRACDAGRPGTAGPAPEHPAVERQVAALKARHAAHCAQVVARAEEAIFHARVPETPMGNLTADLMREAGAEAGGADFAFTNMGSVRAALRAGDVTECDLHAVWPFNDPLVIVRMTGADVTRLFTFLMVEVGKTPAVSGLLLERADGTVRVLDAATGAALDPARTYRLATTQYLVMGGDRVDEIIRTLPADAVSVLAFPSYRDALRQSMQRRGTLRAPEVGRIRGR